MKDNSSPRFFIDSYIERCDEKLLILAWRLGYRAVSCLDASIKSENDRKGLPVVVRKKVISASSVSELKEKLRESDHKSEFITVHPLSIEVARWCAHDGRVDSILVSNDNIQLFDKKQLSVIKYYSKPIEVSMRDLLGDLSMRSALYRRLSLYLSRRAPFILSSRAREWYELYHPISLVRIVSTQYEIPARFILLSITNIPGMILSNKKMV